MKRFLAAVLIAALCMTLCLTLTACDAPKVRVESSLVLTDEYKGSRTVTVVYPLSASIDAVKDDILAEHPAADVDGVEFSYLGAAENGYSFELKLSFESASQYEEQVGALIGRDANAVVALKDNVFLSGTRVAEDFDVSELIGWIVRDTQSAESTKDYIFDYAVNKVTVGGDTYDTASTVSVNECKGIPVNSVDVKTYNEKTSLFGRTFDRSFVFTIPADTYSQYKRKINAYFEELSGSAAQISDSHEGNNILYTLIFEGLSLDELETTTSAILASDSVSVFYGDKGDLSTPLFEGRVLEERLDTLSYYGPEGDPPALKYTYSLPTNAVRGEGALYINGGWENTGTWDDGAYRLEDSSGLTHLRIFDGRQYYIDGVDFEIASLGDGKFKRTASLLYPIKDGFEGPVYATKFFESKKASAEYNNDGEHIVCSVVCQGTVDEVNTGLEIIFGPGNYITYEKTNGALSDKTTLTDHIDIREMLSIENVTIPMTYTALAENGENIVTLTQGFAEIAYRDKSESKVAFLGGQTTVGYHGVIPKAGSILLYLIFGAALLVITTLLAYRMLMPPIRRERAAHDRPMTELSKEPQSFEPAPKEKTPAYAPQQTTTFSIFELGILSRNKKYVEEINKDVEDRLYADRLQERKKELRQKELEEMEKKVYGTQETAEKAAAEPVDETADYDGPKTIEILNALEVSEKNPPAPIEPSDPMELLDLMDKEEDDD